MELSLKVEIVLTKEQMDRLEKLFQKCLPKARKPHSNGRQ